MDAKLAPQGVVIAREFTPLGGPAFRAAYRLDRANVRVLAVKRPPADIGLQLQSAVLAQRSSFILGRLHLEPSFEGRASFDVAVSDGRHTQFCQGLQMFIGAARQTAFIPAARNGLSVLWHADYLHLVQIPFDEDERAEGLDYASRLMRMALRVYPLG